MITYDEVLKSIPEERRRKIEGRTKELLEEIQEELPTNSQSTPKDKN